MSTDRPIRGVAFDIDGTLYPNHAMYRASLGIVLRNLRLFRAFGSARRSIRTRHPVTDLRRETGELTAAALGAPVEETMRRIDEVIYRRWETVLERVSLYPGAAELLGTLRERGIRLAAMSDFPVTRKLITLGLEGSFDLSFSSEEVGYLKPNLEPFRELVARMILDPGEILYVGNSYDYDVVGAAAAGMRTAHLTGNPRRPGIADVAVRDFAGLRDWLIPRLP